MDEAIRMCDGNKIALPELSDTWRLIDKYNINYTTSNGKIYIDIDDTKYLVGTTDEAPEYYRYWED